MLLSGIGTSTLLMMCANPAPHLTLERTMYAVVPTLLIWILPSRSPTLSWYGFLVDVDTYIVSSFMPGLRPAVVKTFFTPLEPVTKW